MDQGFILTRHAHDTRQGVCVSLWVKTKHGPVKINVDYQQPVFFIKQDDADLAEKIIRSANITQLTVKLLSLKNFAQQPMAACYFHSMRDFYRAKECLASYDLICYETDFRPEERYLTERFITASVDFIGESRQLETYRQVEQAKCKASAVSQTDINLSMVSLDIECSRFGELYSIGLYSDSFQCVLMIGEPEQANTENEADNNDYIVWVADERELLERLILWFKQADPDIIIGWSVVNFDFKLLQKRCDHYGINFAISREGTAPYWRTNKASGQQYCEIAGRVILDGIDLLKTATYQFASFSLENVSRELLGLGKKVDDVENRLEEITNNFLNNKPALAAYNLEDCRLVWLIFEKTNLLAFAKLRSQLTGLALDRSGGSVAAFTNLYLPKLHRAGYVAPNMGDGISGLVSPGGYVMDSIPGLYQNVLVLDFKSLYPSIIKTFNIDPMGMIEGLHEQERFLSADSKQPSVELMPIAGFDGAYFSREKHFLPAIISELWQERDKAKAEKNDALSQAIKIIMNSFYGVLGSTGCRFFDPRLSGSITKRSHALLKQTKQWIEDKGYRVIYGDTDSIFVHVGEELGLEASRALGAELQNFINEKMRSFIKQEHQLESFLEIEFETHFSKFFMPTIRGQEVGTKKRYAGLIEHKSPEQESKQEAEQETGLKVNQEIVFKGLESVRTDWTELAKEFQQSLYFKVFNQLPVADYIRSIVAAVKAGEVDDKLVYRKRLRRKLSDYVKNVPPHVKAARLADLQNAEQGKELRYQRGGHINYYMTINGPQAVEYLTAPLDYDFYIERQLLAIADAILPFIGSSFSEITDAQLDLFGR